MSDATGRFKIVNQLGLHARAATKLVQLASKYPCDVEIARVAGAGHMLHIEQPEAIARLIERFSNSH